MADRREVKVDILGDATSYKKAMAEAEHQTGKSGSIMTGIFQGVGQAATGLAVEGIGKVIGFLGESSQKAREDEVVTSRLTTALRENVKGFTGTADAMDASLKAGVKLGFMDDEVTASLAKLVPVTHNAAQAQKDSALAMDVARLRGVDLATATDIVAKAQLGNVGALQRMGIAVPTVTAAVDALRASSAKATPEQIAAAKAADKQATATAALASLQQAANGQAMAYAGTMQGSMAVASATVEGIQQKLGTTLNQIVAAVLPPLVAGLGQVADWFGQLATAAQPFVEQAVQLGGQVMAAVSAGLAEVTAAIQPMMPVIQQLAGEYLKMLGDEFRLVAGFISSTVVPVITNVVKAVLPPLTAALKWIAQDVLPALAGAFQHIAAKVIPLVTSGIGWITKNVLPPLGAAFGWIVKNVLPPVVAAFKWIVDNVFPALATGFDLLTDTVIPALSNAFQGIAKVIGGVMGGIAGTVKSVINGVIGGINALIRAIDSVKFNIHIPNPLGGNFDFGFAGVNLGTIPYLHSGGIVPGSPGSDVLTVLQAGERVTPRGAAPGVVNININGAQDVGALMLELKRELTRTGMTFA